MKSCPKCGSQFSDGSLNFCLQDGTALLEANTTDTLTAVCSDAETVASAPQPQTQGAGGGTTQTRWNVAPGNIPMGPPERSGLASFAIAAACAVLISLVILGIGVILYLQKPWLVEVSNSNTGRPTPASSNQVPAGTPSSFTTGSSNIGSPADGKTVSGGALNSSATQLPPPEYPEAAKAVRASGQVIVQITVDEKGKVISATATYGHPLLRSAAEEAARKARFPPKLLNGTPVKVTGVLTYNFVP
ncbi:MAG: TonB family protein [Acidobacteria bacterium]|nr:TonB family protein [Acidobacteriota bacterium]